MLSGDSAIVLKFSGQAFNYMPLLVMTIITPIKSDILMLQDVSLVPHTNL